MSNGRVAYVHGTIPRGDQARALFSNLGVLKKLAASRTAFVKLNLCAAQRYDSASGVCTSTASLVDLVHALRDCAPGLRILAGDSDSTGYGFAHDKFRHQALPEAAEREDFTLVDLSRDETVLMPCNGSFFPELPLARSVAEADFFISLSKIKTHNITRVTGTIKNCFGLLPQGEKKRYHPYLDAVLADIHNTRPPDLCLLDGRPAMQGNGPIHGEPVDLGLTILGDDALATDLEMCRLIGIRPAGVSHLRGLARQLGRDVAALPALVGLEPRPAAIRFREPPGSQQRLIRLGLGVQSVGANIEELGHLVHFAQKMGDLRKLRRFAGRVYRKGRLF
ncbi:MAG: DUF362 domain-containing protein [bacterium]|nr:DUF362 domain-containing protein [bacterium]